MSDKVYPRLGRLFTIEELEYYYPVAPRAVNLAHSHLRQIDRHCDEIEKALSSPNNVNPEIVDRLRQIRTYVSTAKWTDWLHGGYDTTS